MIENCLMRILDQKVFIAFGAVPFDRRSSVATIEKWMLSTEKQVQFLYYQLMLMFGLAFEDDCELSFILF